MAVKAWLRTLFDRLWEAQYLVALENESCFAVGDGEALAAWLAARETLRTFRNSEPPPTDPSQPQAGGEGGHARTFAQP